MTWKKVLKNQPINWKDPKYRNTRIFRPRPAGNFETAADVNVGAEEESVWEDVETGKVVESDAGGPKEKGMWMGEKASRDNFKAWKAANQDDYYQAITRILKIYAGTRTVQPQRNAMEVAIGNFWEEALVSLRKLYDTVEKMAVEAEADTTEPYLNQGKESGYVIEQAEKEQQLDLEAWNP